MRPPIPLSILLGLNSLSLAGWAQQPGGNAPNPAPVTAPVPLKEAPEAPGDANAARGETAPTARALAPDAVAPNAVAPNAGAPDAGAPDAEPKRDGHREGSEMRLRAMMSDLGLGDSAKQDAVIAYLKEDESGQNVVRGALRRLSFAMTHGADDGRIRDLIAVYKAALDADKERRNAAQNALNAKIGFTLDARIEAVLWLFGVLGDGAGGPPQGLMQRPLQNRGAAQNGVKTHGDGLNLGDGKAVRRPETVCGTVADKGTDWIEVRDERGKVERFFTFWTATAGDAGNRPDRALLESIRTAALGTKIQLTWVWSDRKRVIKIEPWTPDKTSEIKAPEVKTPDAKTPDAPEPDAAPAAPDAAPAAPDAHADLQAGPK